MEFIRQTLTIMVKDLRAEVRSKEAINASFGFALVILILFSIIPFLVPLPMMFLGLITASLQAFIFVLLTTIYLGGAVATEHEQHEHAEMAAGEV